MGSQSVLFPPTQPILPASLEQKGVVYTKPWVVEFLLDLAGYTANADLQAKLIIEPSAGQGAFLLPIVRRLVASCQRNGQDLINCSSSLIAFELDPASALIASDSVTTLLVSLNVPLACARELVGKWIRTGDFLFESFGLPKADFVVGNPPYVRLEDIPPEVANAYRKSYLTMSGRADLYIAFYEASLRQLKDDGVSAFICADRWMLNQYGAQLRGLVTSGFAVDTIVEMHEANAFDDDVSAYPAITVIRKGAQKTAVVARVDSSAEIVGASRLANDLETSRHATTELQTQGLRTATVTTWFQSSDPWPCASPKRLSLLRKLEECFKPLEEDSGRTKVGIGVATGLDEVFITKDENAVEKSRLLPLAMAKDTLNGNLEWSGHFLVNPWSEDGLVDLDSFPRLARHFLKHRELVARRNTAQKNPNNWYRTIDRVNHSLVAKRKLYIPDIKDQFNPVLDDGQTYPHHNLYFVASDSWDLEVLGGILLSALGQFFVECYGVRMRGGYLRFQAQYLRRIRVPNPETISPKVKSDLIRSFRKRDRLGATAAALSAYNVAASELELALEHR